jgi:hypothetical protein
MKGSSAEPQENIRRNPVVGKRLALMNENNASCAAKRVGDVI